MLRGLYDWTMRLAAHHRADHVLAAIAFAESSFFPIPPDILLIPMVLARRERAWRLAVYCTIASVIGGLFGYAIGYFLFETIGRPLLQLYGYVDQFANFQARYNDWGAWIVLIAGVTPFPYKVITIASGVSALSLPTFMLASVLARGLRFFIVAGLLWAFGEPIRDFIERYLPWLFTLFMVLLLGGFVIVRYVM
jgi:membrane protein YqaA with SNARE-associated domain